MPRAVLPIPAKQVAHDCLLPTLQLERLPRLLALRERAARLDKVDDVLGTLAVEPAITRLGIRIVAGD